MKKFILPITLLLTAVLFLPPKADAQTRQECEKTRDRASYNCLLGFGKCYSPCVAETKDNMGCRDSCKQAENACDKEVDTQYKICLETLPKTKENTPTEKAEQVEAQTNPDCHEVFTKESNACLKESTECINSCVDKGYAAMSLTVDGGKVMKECTRSVCDPASKACDDQAMANFRACQDAKSATKASVKEDKSPLEKLLDMPVFIGEWLDLISAGSAGLAFLDLSNELGSLVLADPEIAIWEEEQRQKYNKDFEEYIQEHPYLSKDELDRLINRPSTVDEISGYKSGVWEKDSPYRLDYLNGEASIKYPGENEWKDLKTGDKIPPGSRIFTGMDATTMITIKDKGVIQVLPFTEITVNEYGLDRATTAGQTTTDIKIDTGEIEVYTEKQYYEDLVRWRPSLRVQFFNNYAAPRGTHFWVSYDKVKNLSTIGVYKGEVEVKSQGETRLVTPTSDGPGVLVVSQKFSPVKLGILGLVIVGIIGGTGWIIKRKLLQKTSKKK